MVHLSEKVLRAITLTPTGDCYAFNSFTYQDYLHKGFKSIQLGPCIKYLVLLSVLLVYWTTVHSFVVACWFCRRWSPVAEMNYCRRNAGVLRYNKYSNLLRKKTSPSVMFFFYFGKGSFYPYKTKITLNKYCSGDIVISSFNYGPNIRLPGWALFEIITWNMTQYSY